MAQTAAHLVDQVIPHVPVRQWVLDGVYRRNTDGAPVFMEVLASTDEVLQTVLHTIITRLMKLLTRKGVLVGEEGSTCMARPAWPTATIQTTCACSDRCRLRPALIASPLAHAPAEGVDGAGGDLHGVSLP